MLEVELLKKGTSPNSMMPRPLSVLIPFVKQIVPHVEVPTKAAEHDGEGGVWITPPDGLLDLAVVKEEKVQIRGLLAPAKGWVPDEIT